MPKVALADTLWEWESLLAAATEKGEGIPGLEGQLVELRAALEQARALDVFRQRLQADRQQATADLAALRVGGQDLASRIRGRLVAKFGTHSEGLVQFGIRLRRGRRPGAASRKASPPAADDSKPSTPLDR
jgi:hypothetical protein